MQLKADALVRCEPTGLNPRGETISGGGLDWDIVANAGEINVGFPVKCQPQGTIAGVFLLRINTNLHGVKSFGNEPGKAAIPNT